jgi:cytochrome P450
MVISKQCTENVHLELTKGTPVLIEKGTNVYIPVYDLHHDPEYFPRPNDFIPERCVKFYSNHGFYLPFGSGPRQCLGTKFASLVCKAALIEAVSSFKISINEKTNVNLRHDPNEFLNVKEGGLWLNFKPVKMFEIGESD